MLSYFVDIFINQQQSIGRMLTDCLLPVCILVLFYPFRKKRTSLGMFAVLVPFAVLAGIAIQSVWYAVCDGFSLPESSAFLVPPMVQLSVGWLLFHGERGMEYLMRGMMFYGMFVYIVNIFYVPDGGMLLQFLLELFLLFISMAFLCCYRVDLRFEKSYIFVLLFGCTVLPGILIEIFYYLLIMNVVLDEAYMKDIAGANSAINVCLYLLQVFVYIAFGSIVKQYRHTQMVQEENYQMKLSEESAVLKEKTYAELSEMRHDLKNQLSYLFTLARQGDSEKLMEHIDQMSDDMAYLGRHCATENKVVGVALDMEITKAEQKNIPVLAAVRVARKLSIRDVDFCSLLSNLMDNAIEAIEKGDCADRLLTVSVSQIRGYLCIMVKNQVAGMPDGDCNLLRTDKEDAKGHGWGTKIIRKIAEKYEGCVRFHVEDGYFIADVMLKLNDEVEEIDDARYQTGGL